MTIHLERDLDKVRKQLLNLGSLVKENTYKSTEYLETHSAPLRADISKLEEQINELEVDIEEECLKILALHQPVAIDLRFIIAVMKVTSDLERMGDQAINIAHRVDALVDQEALKVDLPVTQMAALVEEMVSGCLEALVKQDTALAQKVVDMDDDIDDLHAENYVILRNAVIAHPETVGAAMSFATISSNLERVGDLCTNIAEDIIFMMDGKIIRHVN